MAGNVGSPRVVLSKDALAVLSTVTGRDDPAGLGYAGQELCKLIAQGYSLDECRRMWKLSRGKVRLIWNKVLRRLQAWEDGTVLLLGAVAVAERGYPASTSK